MDLYTTSFTLPAPNPLLPTPESTSLPVSSSVSSLSSSLNSSNSIGGHINDEKFEKDWELVQQLAVDVTAREGCLVTVTREPFSPTSTLDPQPNGLDQWNFHLSGSYQSVMAARESIIRGCPRDNSVRLKVSRNDILDSPLTATSPLKPEVYGRLDSLAMELGTEIIVVNGDSGPEPGIILSRLGPGMRDGGGSVGSRHTRTASGQSGSSGSSIPRSANMSSVQSTTTTLSSVRGEQGEESSGEDTGEETYGLELERVCEIVISGSMEAVQIAKVKILVLLDELTGLHAEPCEIDYKLHSILAGHKRISIQSIEEETATNIYLPIPLVGILNPSQPHPQSTNGHNTSYRSIQSVGTMTSQNTGMTQMTGYSQTGMENGWGMAESMSNGYGQMGRHQYSQVYHPQHRHHYEPQHQMGYGGPSNHHHHHQQYRHLPHNGGMSIPMSVQHTGMSNMTEYQNPRGGPSPRYMGMPNGFNQGYQTHQHHHHPQPVNFHHPHQYQHQHQHGFPSHPGYPSHNAHSPNPPHQMLGMGMNPYSNGHGHAGLGGNHMAMNGGMMMGNAQQGPSSNIGGPGQFSHSPHPGLSIHGGEQGSMGKANEIWITGEFFGVQRARDMLLNLAMQKSRMVISRDTAILPRKLDWLLTDRLEDIKKIMSDNGTYLQVPPVGSQASLITVFGDHRVAIERTIRSIMALACQFYVASVWLLPLKFDVHHPQPTLNAAQIQPMIKRIATATSAEVVFKSNSFEVHGLETEVREAVSMILELDIIKNFQPEIRFHIELANEHRDFISGKKNGKINKIMKIAGVKIKFETYNDYNFLMDVSGSNISTLQGLSLLQEELPTELSFHIPENYHKRIIGVGGKNVQRIMKLYGVYVKFSNAEEYAALGGYKENEDNVIARTPRKNVENLESLKSSIMEFVASKNKDYLSECILVPRRYHRTLLGEKSIFIHDIENKTNSIVRFPSKESASDIITIFGPESQVEIAVAMILDHVPFEADLYVPSNSDITALIASPGFISFTEDIKRDHQIAISLAAYKGRADEAMFMFRCQRSHVSALGLAQDALEEYLAEQDIQLFPPGSKRKDVDFEDILSIPKNRSVKTQVKAQTLEPEEIIIPVQVRSRPISNEVIALFDEPSSLDDTPGTNKGFAGPLSYHNPRRSSEIWQSPQAMRNDLTSTPPLTELHLKRESDPLIHDKIRQATVGPGVPLTQVLGHGHGPSRGAAARTQSLDITSSLHFSRALSSNGTGFGSLIDSSPGVIGDSPNTASGLYFPSSSAGVLGAKGLSKGLGDVTNALGNVHI